MGGVGGGPRDSLIDFCNLLYSQQRVGGSRVSK